MPAHSIESWSTLSNFLHISTFFFFQNGEAIFREVKDKRTSILWLWRAHNKANIRLSGDITDDKAFPKEVCIFLRHSIFFYISSKS